MKVTFLIPNMSGGGAERVISILADEFLKKGLEVSILMTAGDECAYDLDPCVRLFQAGGKTGGSLVKRMNRLMKMRRYFKENRDNILIAFEPDAAFWGSVAKAGFHMPMLSSERNDPASFGNSKARAIAYHYSSGIVFQTQEAREYFPKNIQKKGWIIPNPLRSDLPLPYTGKRKKTVVCVGRFEKQKNHMVLLNAYAKFDAKYPDYTLHLYGKGSLENEIRVLTRELHLETKVVFEGFKGYYNRNSGCRDVCFVLGLRGYFKFFIRSNGNWNAGNFHRLSLRGGPNVYPGWHKWVFGTCRRRGSIERFYGEDCGR